MEENQITQKSPSRSLPRPESSSSKHEPVSTRWFQREPEASAVPRDGMSKTSSFEGLSDDELEIRTRKLAEQEQHATLLVLDHLHELQCRYLYAKRGFPSLFAYCTEVLGYSEPAAAERIAAMRLMYAIPTVRYQIQAGDLTLSSAARVHRFLKNAEKLQKIDDLARNLRVAGGDAPKEQDDSKETGPQSTIPQKILFAVSGKSVRETDRILNQLLPEANQIREWTRRTESGVDFRLRMSEESFEKLERVRELRQMASFSETIAFLAQFYLSRQDPMRRVRVPQKGKNEMTSPEKLTSSEPADQSPPLNSGKKGSKPESGTQDRVSRKPFAAEVRRRVWASAGGQCEYVDPKTRHRCSSRAYLQIDHIIPYAVGGGDHESNLRLLCAAHNRLLAIQFFGSHKIPLGRNSLLGLDLSGFSRRGAQDLVSAPEKPASSLAAYPGKTVAKTLTSESESNS